MNLFVLLKMVPDTVEELAVAADNTSLDPEFLRFKLSDSDEHALEQALILKERQGGQVTVVALDSPEVDDALYTALAKGADRAVKLSGELAAAQSLAAAKVFASFLKGDGQALPPDSLVLLRSQSIDDLEGEVGPYLADLLGVPYACVVTGVTREDGTVTVTKEFAGGLRGAFSLPLPAVLGIQSAEKPPRYAPIAKVRLVMKSAKIQTVETIPPEKPACFPVERMYKPEATGRAQMLEGAPEAVTDQVLEVLAKNSLI
jgi:electron transfer flavoprotein beta subunit